MGLGLGLGLTFVPRAGSGGGGTPAPVLTSRNYDTFFAAGGDSITLTGTDLGSASSCDVNGSPVTITANDATSLTFTTPAIAAGSYNVTVTTAGGTSNALTVEAYDLTSVSWTARYEASYSGSPWVPVAGTAGNLSEATNPATVGAAVNGFTPADFDGVDDLLSGANGSSFVAGGAGTSSTILALVYVDAVAADAVAGSPQLNEGIIALNGAGFVGIGISVAGSRPFVNDGTYKQTTPASVACSTGAWHMIWMRWTGGAMNHGVDVAPTAGQTAAVTNGPSNLAFALRVGVNFGTAFADLKMLALLTVKSGLADADINKITTGYRCHFALP